MISRAGHNVEYDVVNDELWHTNPEGQAILVFRGGADGEEAPIRVIQGPHTHMEFPNYALRVDTIHNEVYVVDKQFITVYPRTAKGDVAPIREIRGPDTQLINARGLAIDPVRNVLLVGTNNGVLIFNRTDNGNAKPRAVISGPLSGIRARGAIQSMEISPKGYFVAIVGTGGGDDDEEGGRAAAAGGEGRGGGGGGRNRGPSGGPGGIAAWRLTDFLSVNGKGDVAPVYVLTDPTGSYGPGRFALNPNNKEVVLGGDHITIYSFPEIF
jgi:hypothetical protein